MLLLSLLAIVTYGGLFGPSKWCVDCDCIRWDGNNYSGCTEVTPERPCGSYCVKCQEDGVTPMPGLYTKHADECKAYADETTTTEEGTSSTTEETTEAPALCVGDCCDVVAACQDFADECLGEDNKNVREHCPATCGLCDCGEDEPNWGCEGEDLYCGHNQMEHCKKSCNENPLCKGECSDIHNTCGSCVSDTREFGGKTKRACDWVNNNCIAVNDPANKNWKELFVPSSRDCPPEDTTDTRPDCMCVTEWDVEECGSEKQYGCPAKACDAPRDPYASRWCLIANRGCKTDLGGWAECNDRTPVFGETAVGSGEEYVAITEGKCEDHDLMPVTDRSDCTDALIAAGMSFKKTIQSYSYTRGCLFSTKSNDGYLVLEKRSNTYEFSGRVSNKKERLGAGEDNEGNMYTYYCRNPYYESVEEPEVLEPIVVDSDNSASETKEEEEAAPECEVISTCDECLVAHNFLCLWVRGAGCKEASRLAPTDPVSWTCDSSALFMADSASFSIEDLAVYGFALVGVAAIVGGVYKAFKKSQYTEINEMTRL